MEMNWSYVTAYFEADGTAHGFTLSDRPNSCSVGIRWMSTDSSVIEKIADFLDENVTSYDPSDKRWKKHYYVAVNDHIKLRQIIPIILEHCFNDRKKQQLQDILDFINNREWIEETREKKRAVILKLYHEQGLSQAEVVAQSDEFNGIGALRYYITKFGLQRRGKKRDRKLKVLEELYVGQGLTPAEIAKVSDEFKTSKAVDYYIGQYGYERRGRQY